MIRPLEDNDTVSCILLMDQSWHHNNGYSVGYTNKNEASWVRHLMEHISKSKDNPHFFTMGNWAEDGHFNGFMLASTFRNYYTEEWTMDVKDCIVDHRLKNTAFTVIRLYDAMFEHMKQHNGIYWRADSVREFNDCAQYSRLLEKRYNGVTSLSIRGRL